MLINTFVVHLSYTNENITTMGIENNTLGLQSQIKESDLTQLLDAAIAWNQGKNDMDNVRELAKNFTCDQLKNRLTECYRSRESLDVQLRLSAIMIGGQELQKLVELKGRLSQEIKAIPLIIELIK